MYIGLVGWGLETQSIHRFFGDNHNYLIVNEEPIAHVPDGKNITIRANVVKRSPGLSGNSEDTSYLDGIEDCDIVAVTPTAHKVLEKKYLEDHGIWQKVTTNVKLFFEHCPTDNIIGVTGTKGKGTTASLTAELLKAGGKTVHLGGNIGIPALDLLTGIKKEDWVVLELSNFQLYKFPYSPHIAVHLMLMREHIDEWHIELDDYVETKANIFRNQTEKDIAIYLPSNEYTSSSVKASKGQHIPYMQAPGARIENGIIVIDSTDVMPANEVGLLGMHNLENICAAVTASWQVHQDAGVMRRVIRQFKGLEHRLQTVATINDVRYVDDSFGTTPDTAIIAMDTFTEPKVMIIGGHDKGNDMSGMIERLKQPDIRSIIGIGSVGNSTVKVLQKSGPKAKIHSKDDYNDWTMSEIIDLACKEAQSGDVVLLSAGTSSFGIFEDYKDRGNQFIAAVKHLAETKQSVHAPPD